MSAARGIGRPLLHRPSIVIDQSTRDLTGVVIRRADEYLDLSIVAHVRQCPVVAYRFDLVGFAHGNLEAFDGVFSAGFGVLLIGVHEQDPVVLERIALQQLAFPFALGGPQETQAGGRMEIAGEDGRQPDR